MLQVDPQYFIIGGVVISAVIAVVTAVIKGMVWLADQFNNLKETVSNWMDLHEAKDQQRHVDNIERFAKIEAKLDIVLKNGIH